MIKTGKLRNPTMVIVLIFISIGIYGIVWYAISMEELRKYRRKGLSGFVPVILISLNIMYTVIFNGETGFIYLIFPYLISIFFWIYAFVLPYQIETEICKINLIKRNWVIIGLLPIIAMLLTSVLPLLLKEFFGNSLTFESTNLVFLLISLVLNILWLVYVQTKLNLLWKIAVKTDHMATPVMDYTNSDQPIEEYYEQ